MIISFILTFYPAIFLLILLQNRVTELKARCSVFQCGL